jgi:hypothetical protein
MSNEWKTIDTKGKMPDFGGGETMKRVIKIM